MSEHLHTERTRRPLLQRKLGFRAQELMSGWHRFEPGQGPEGRRGLSFRVTWGTDDLRPWLRWGAESFMRNTLQGTLDADGLGWGLPCEGALLLRYLDEHLLRYNLDFQARVGQEEAPRRLQLVGEKVDIQAWNLPVSHTTCFVRIVDPSEGRLISTGVVFFRLRTLGAFLGSFRLALN